MLLSIQWYYKCWKVVGGCVCAARFLVGWRYPIVESSKASGTFQISGPYVCSPGFRCLP